MMYCVKCGRFNDDRNTVCYNCNYMFISEHCDYCDAPLEGECEFCYNCGAPVNHTRAAHERKVHECTYEKATVKEILFFMLCVFIFPPIFPMTARHIWNKQRICFFPGLISFILSVSLGAYLAWSVIF